VRVLEAKPADLIFAGLPYNVNYSGSSRSKGKVRPGILNDNLGKFLYDMCVAMLAVAGGALYVAMSSSELHTLYKAFTDAGGHWSTYIIWAKDTFTIGRSPYHRQFEPVLFGWTIMGIGIGVDTHTFSSVPRLFAADFFGLCRIGFCERAVFPGDCKSDRLRLYATVNRAARNARVTLDYHFSP
jgi:hypothetical protein